ncbi:hypothetical protein EDC01DRAFT_658053 [Geopyxis carbonaria]|nr:hypothetical protein EDC01DRAFT_658053 [Geopyxis carbonaria]
MFSWLRGAPPPTESTTAEPVEEVDLFPEGDSFPPQDPAAIFAVKAFRTAIFGTPALKPPPRRPQVKPISQQVNRTNSEENIEGDKNKRVLEVSDKEEKGKQPVRQQEAVTDGPGPKSEVSRQERQARNQRLFFPEEHADDTLSLEPIPFKITSKTNLFEPTASISTAPPVNLFQATPARPSSPTKGILVAPGTALRDRKKAVTFDPSVETPKGNTHVRSGLPHEFPGKFPSPWTPRTGNTPSLKHQRSASFGALEEKSNNKSGKKRSVGFEVTEDSRIEDILDEPDHEDDLPLADQGDLTTDMNAPRSSSGQYWKEHATNLEGLALSKVEKLRGRCHTAINYAKRKDELCADLAERLREVVDKNQRLKNELRRVNRVSQGSTQDGDVLADAMRLIAEKDTKINSTEDEMVRMQGVIEQYAARLNSFEEMLNHREEKITELSMSLYSGETTINEDLTTKEQVEELRQKLRKARQEAKDFAPVRLQCRTYKNQISKLEREKLSLEAQLDKMKSIGDESTRFSARSDNIETLLRTQVEDLEKSQRDLKAEMRAKLAESSKERREAEKALRADITDLKSKLVGEEMDKKELQREKERLQGIIANLEKDLVKAKAEKAEARFAIDDGTSNEWHKNHRMKLQELRMVKEELAQLKMQTEQTASHPPARSWVPAKEAATPKKHSEIKVPSSSSDDSAIDRSYDRIGRPDIRAASKSPIKSVSNGFSNIPLLPIPAENQQDMPDSSFDLPDPPSLYEPTPRAQVEPEFTDIFAAPQASTPIKVSSASFLNARREKASPRPSVVNLSVSPVAKRRTTIGANKKAGAVSKGLEGMDPARRAAAERRIAERKARRKTTGA